MSPDAFLSQERRLIGLFERAFQVKTQVAQEGHGGNQVTPCPERVFLGLSARPLIGRRSFSSNSAKSASYV